MCLDRAAKNPGSGRTPEWLHAGRRHSRVMSLEVFGDGACRFGPPHSGSPGTGVGRLICAPVGGIHRLDGGSVLARSRRDGSRPALVALSSPTVPGRGLSIVVRTDGEEGADEQG